MDEPLLNIKKLKGITFRIDKYQRGYRWGLREIHSLLDDILCFDSTKEDFYCLQPLVLRKRGESEFELLDGQQRTTTIYLILKFLLDENFYTLKYETRGDEQGLNEFLEKINNHDCPNFIEIVPEELDKQISIYWKKDFLSYYTSVKDSVDNFYFFKAYCIIKRWFTIDESRREILKRNLLDCTKLIWYVEKTDDQSVAKTFINFNDGKISLDQAELIKGLFSLNFNAIVDATRKSYEENQFADEWNNIEHHLKVPSFWNFIHTEKDNRELANKITLLLQIEKGKAKKGEDVFYTYREYEKAFKSPDKPEWRNLSTLYNLLDEWYNDRETYHLMGAVVHLTSTSIHQVIANYKAGTKKNELNEYLKGILRDEFFKGSNDFTDRYNPDKLKYGKGAVHSILLLYNIAVAQITDKHYRFPFDRFKNVKSWNIEHIYAKNSKGFETIDDLESWRDELSGIISDNPELGSNKELQKLWNDVNTSEKLRRLGLETSNELVKKIEVQLSETLDKDSLSNLCFLDNVTNIQVGNKVFRKKREMILELKQPLGNESYVPIASKHIFQKSLTPSESLLMNYWNTIDREAYINDVKIKIKSFLTKK